MKSIHIRVSEGIYQQLVTLAAADRRSVSAFSALIIERHLDQSGGVRAVSLDELKAQTREVPHEGTVK